MGTKLPDEIAACNLIRRRRKASRMADRSNYHKYITRRVSVEEGRQISTQIRLTYNPRTDSIVVDSALTYYSHSIYPSTHRKLVCTNDAALDTLENCRKCDREGHRRR